MKTISAIIPTYNRAYCIQRAIESVLAQTYPVHEIIVVDDGSTDHTRQVVADMADDRVKYFYCRENRGAGAARNYGVRQAKGEYIAFHDSDDIWLPCKLEKQMRKFEENPYYGLVYAAYHLQGLCQEKIVPDFREDDFLEGDIFNKLLHGNTIGTPLIVMKKEVFEIAKGFDENLHFMEDWEFALKISKNHLIGFVPEVLMEATRSLDSMTKSMSGYYQSNCYILRKYLNDYVKAGIFEEVTYDLLARAEKAGLLPQVSKMLELYLKN